MSYLAQSTYYTITYYNLQSVFPRRRLHVLAGVTAGCGWQEYDLVSQQGTLGGGAAQHVILARVAAGRPCSTGRGAAEMTLAAMQ
jgi:hypothetical protein